jgi:DNA-binding XRE family transcriptional regulator
MDSREFLTLRQRLQKTQKEMAQLLGTSIRAVQSFEQGWRKIPPLIERQMLFLAARKDKLRRNTRPCWEVRKCSPDLREACPAWEFRVVDLCWFINGTICRGKPEKNWNRKMEVCRKCEVFGSGMRSPKSGS